MTAHEHVENINLDNFWHSLLNELEINCSKLVAQTINSTSGLEKIEDGKAYITCENLFAKTRLEKNKEALEAAINKVGKGKYEVIIGIGKKPIHTKSHERPQIDTNDQEKSLGPLFNPESTKKPSLIEKQLEAGLSPRYTFENFIPGKNNQLAHAIATAVAERPGEVYTPVFIYSGVGLGKTHLIQAIGNRIVEKRPSLKVVYTTGEAFMNELIETIQNSKGKGKYTSNKFRNKFRKVDVFLIDDIQYIIGKGATQDEFFHTFNTLQMAQKQIVITSDRPPKEFDNLAERITSRFSSGIIVDIQPPDIEVRAAILRNRRDLNKDAISNEIINFIAENVSSNIRELEGAYIQVTGLVKTGGEVTIEKVAETLKINKKTKDTKPVNINQILKAVCTYYSVRTADIKGERRTKELVIPRQVAMYLIKELTDMPYITIGEFLGGRDHTTIIHGTERIKKESMQMGKIKQDLVNVKQMIYTE